MEAAQKIFDKIWQDYIFLNPEVKRVYDLFIHYGEQVSNDHIAFRTVNDSRVNIEVLSKQFIDAGYEFRGDYHFKEKHLYAKHFELKAFRNAPRVFISELKLEEMSSELQGVFRLLLDILPESKTKASELLFSGNVWGKPQFSIYEKLRQESEYAAWLYVYGFRANHFTVSINTLKKLDSIQKVNQFLKENGFLLNTVGGEIKGTPKDLLEQSSIKASIGSIDFVEGAFDIPITYYEFARRYPDAKGELYGGFIAQSADKIFESTDFYKKD
ncbi:MAG TPA: DUF1338 domain-containing protein [Bacteroidales bacterium]|nr:DUF1338 domain-containing protein [Bacteroidales bacterium]